MDTSDMGAIGAECFTSCSYESCDMPVHVPVPVPAHVPVPAPASVELFYGNVILGDLMSEYTFFVIGKRRDIENFEVPGEYQDPYNPVFPIYSGICNDAKPFTPEILLQMFDTSLKIIQEPQGPEYRNFIWYGPRIVIVTNPETGEEIYEEFYSCTDLRKMLRLLRIPVDQWPKLPPLPQ